MKKAGSYLDPPYREKSIEDALRGNHRKDAGYPNKKPVLGPLSPPPYDPPENPPHVPPVDSASASYGIHPKTTHTPTDLLHRTEFDEHTRRDYDRSQPHPLTRSFGFAFLALGASALLATGATSTGAVIGAGASSFSYAALGLLVLGGAIVAVSR